MALILPARYRTQPVGPAHIDWNHPLARGLVYLTIGDLPAELVSYSQIERIGGGTVANGKFGNALKSSSDTADGWYSKFDKSLVQSITSAFTVSVHCELTTVPSNGKLFNLPLTNSSWVAPYLTLGLGASGTDGRVYLYNHPGAGAGTTPTRAQFGASTLTAGTRHYIASRDGTTAEALVNGVVSAVNTNTFTTNDVVFGTADSIIQLNRTVSALGEGATAQNYHAALWNRALSLDEKKEFYENPYGLLIPHKPVLYSFATASGILGDESRTASGAVTIPMQVSTGTVTFPNFIDVPSGWTVAGNGTVDLADSPPSMTIHGTGIGTTTSVRKQMSQALTIGANYRFSTKIATNAVRIYLEKTNGGTGDYLDGSLAVTNTGTFTFNFQATTTALWVRYERFTAGDAVLTEFLLQQTDAAPAVTADGAFTIPMQVATGAAVNGGLFEAAGAVAIPMQVATGAAAFVSSARDVAGAVTIPFQAVTGTAILPPARALTGAATIPMQQATGAAVTRYNFARVINGSNQHFEYTPAAGTQTNRSLGFYGHVRFDITPAPTGAYYIADYGNLTSGTGGTARIRIVYDNAAQQFVASSASLDGSQYREARSAVTPIVVSRFYFVGVSVSSTGDIRLIVNKTKTAATVGTIPASSATVCNVFRLGTTARTVPAGRVTGAYGSWVLCSGFVPADSDLDLFADGYYPGNIPGFAAASLWAMSETGTTEADRNGWGRGLIAVNSPPRTTALPVHFAQGTATVPFPAVSGTGLFIGSGTFAFAGSATIPMQVLSGSAFAETEGVRGNFVVPMQSAIGTATVTIPLYSATGAWSIPMQRASGAAQNGTDGTSTYYVTTITNTSGTISLPDQEYRVGLPVKESDVPAGYIVRAYINGAAVRTQLSRRRFWPNGSLKYAEASFLVPVMANGQTINVEWRKLVGSWLAQDTALHSGPTVILNNMTAEWRAISWINRPTPSTIGTDVGPLVFRLSDFLDTLNNSQWIRTVYAGHLVTEWEATAFARRSDNTFHPDFGARVYVRAWDGTGSKPKRIEIGFKTMYGWDDNSVPADATGYRASWDLVVNGSIVRGATIDTPGWSNVNGFKGGAHFSMGTTGKLDWVDTATSSVFTPPTLVHKHKMDYLISGRFLPPIDLGNTFDNTTAKKTSSYTPGTRGFTAPNMSDVGDRDDIGWPATGWTCRTMLAHGSAVAINDTFLHQQVSRVQALAVGSIPCQGYRRTTRGIVPHAPTARIPDSRLLPTLLNSFPEVANGTYTSYITLDEAHFPQLSYFNYLTEGDHHILQLLYGEAGAPGNFTSADFGKNTTVVRYDAGNVIFPVGHQVIRGQIRGIARHVTQIGTAAGIGHPDDLETIYYTRQLEDWCIASAYLPQEEDTWRGGTSHVTNFIYRSANDPIYKPWMHTLVTGATSWVAGLTKRADVIDRATWWVQFPMLAMGGYNDGSDADKRVQSTLYTNDELYYVLNNGDANASRVPFSIVKQWGTPIAVTYGVDGQTVTVGSTIANHDGAVFTPFNSATPVGLTRGQKYYAVQTAGQVSGRGGTLKLSLTVGGSPVTFAAISPISAQAIYRSDPTVLAAPFTDNLNGGQNNGFGLQIIAALKGFYHSVGPNEIVQKAIEYISPYKINGGWAEKAKYAITFQDATEVLVPVTYNGEVVTHNGEIVYAPIPPDTYSGNFTIPFQVVGGTIEFAPGLPGDMRGAVTIPMQTISGEIEAPELVFGTTGNFTIPMQTISGTVSGVAPGRSLTGSATIPMQTWGGTATNAPVSPFGNFVVPMQTISGAAIFVDPVFSLTGSFVIPMQTFVGDMLSDGSPIQGAFTIPMQTLAGEATSEQFAYDVNGNFDIPMMEVVGEALVNAFDMAGDFVIPLQEISGTFIMEVPEILIDGAVSIPMQTFEGTLDGLIPDLVIAGDFSIPFVIVVGDITMEEFKAVSGNFTIPMQRWGGGEAARWTKAPSTTDELWTIISPE